MKGKNLVILIVLAIVLVGLAVNRDGFPLAHEVFAEVDVRPRSVVVPFFLRLRTGASEDSLIVFLEADQTVPDGICHCFGTIIYSQF